MHMLTRTRTRIYNSTHADSHTQVDECRDLGGTELLKAVQMVMLNAPSNGRRHNVMILTDGESKPAIYIYMHTYNESSLD